jgi:hypothetical protein
MATRYLVLGQVAPSATTATTLYTVPSGKDAIISTIVVANRAALGSFRIAVRPAGATLANEHYIAYDVPIGATDSTTLTLGLTLTATDVITIYASSANMTFSAFGSLVDI